MSDRAEAAAARIREQVPILQVLQSYGYRVRDDGGFREQQFQCDLHGTGRDNKPSARVYPTSNSWYCFACDKTRDAIETVRAKEGVKFWEAVKLLEHAYGLDPLPVDYGTDNQPGAVSLVAAKLDPTKTFEQDADTVRNYLDACTLNRDLPLDQLLRFWEAFDEVVHHTLGLKGEGGVWPRDKGRGVLQGLLAKIKQAHSASS